MLAVAPRVARVCPIRRLTTPTSSPPTSSPPWPSLLDHVSKHSHSFTDTEYTSTMNQFKLYPAAERFILRRDPRYRSFIRQVSKSLTARPATPAPFTQAPSTPAPFAPWSCAGRATPPPALTRERERERLANAIELERDDAPPPDPPTSSRSRLFYIDHNKQVRRSKGERVACERRERAIRERV